MAAAAAAVAMATAAVTAAAAAAAGAAEATHMIVGCNVIGRRDRLITRLMGIKIPGAPVDNWGTIMAA